jgi:6-hydroxynicotinate 3-monooxygenase
MAIEDAAVLSRCLDGTDADGVAEAFRRYELTRRPRTSQIQLTSRQNTWMRARTDPHWVYGYDAWQEPLASLSGNCKSALEGRGSHQRMLRLA